MRIFKGAALVILMYILLVAIVGCRKNVSGTYVHQRNLKDYLELRADGTFFLRESGNGMSGRYRVDDAIITLTMDGTGRATQSKIQGDALIDEGGDFWTKGQKPLVETASQIDRDGVLMSQAEAASTVRTLNTLQVVYSTKYPTLGYARSLSTLGAAGFSFCSSSEDSQPQHCRKDSILRCTSAWCPEGNYKYNLLGFQAQIGITDYVIVAIPIDSRTGGKSYCSTSDAVVRFRNGEPLSDTINVRDCQSWSPL